MLMKHGVFFKNVIFDNRRILASSCREVEQELPGCANNTMVLTSNSCARKFK